MADKRHATNGSAMRIIEVFKADELARVNCLGG
jgi:hypothetical protein